MTRGHDGRSWKYVVDCEIEPLQIKSIVEQMRQSWLVREVKAFQGEGRTSFEFSARGGSLAYSLLKKSFAVIIAAAMRIDSFELVTYEHANQRKKTERIARDFFGNYVVLKDQDLRASAA